MSIKTYEPFSVPDAFYEMLVRIERIGSSDGSFSR
jgi:hypothetical protein